MRAIAVDLGGTHATVAIVEDRNILESEVLSLGSGHGLASVLPLLCESSKKLLLKGATDLHSVNGFALSFCGLTDSAARRVLSTNSKYDDAPGLDLQAWCKRELGLPFRIENDARMALLGECYAGAGRGQTDVVMITLGTGIGGAAMMHGQLVVGKHILGGNLCGHLPVVFNGRRCTCGAIGCAEAEAAGWSLPQIAKEWPGFAESELASKPEVNFRELFGCASAGDRVSVELRDRCLHIWASLSVGLIHAYDPELIIIGGGVMQSADVIVPYIQQYVNQYSWTPWGKVQIRAAELENRAGLLGAIPLLAQL